MLIRAPRGSGIAGSARVPSLAAANVVLLHALAVGRGEVAFGEEPPTGLVPHGFQAALDDVCLVLDDHAQAEHHHNFSYPRLRTLLT